ncbi:MAG: hypothetical protein K1X89_29725 [Myxococcaceae bacterium]|nr:hypothetical protein [Myxococcaceae bacterium]
MRALLLSLAIVCGSGCATSSSTPGPRPGGPGAPTAAEEAVTACMAKAATQGAERCDEARQACEARVSIRTCELAALEGLQGEAFKNPYDTRLAKLAEPFAGCQKDDECAWVNAFAGDEVPRCSVVLINRAQTDALRKRTKDERRPFVDDDPRDDTPCLGVRPPMCEGGRCVVYEQLSPEERRRRRAAAAQ